MCCQVGGAHLEGREGSHLDGPGGIRFGGVAHLHSAPQAPQQQAHILIEQLGRHPHLVLAQGRYSRQPLLVLQVDPGLDIVDHHHFAGAHQLVAEDLPLVLAGQQLLDARLHPGQIFDMTLNLHILGQQVLADITGDLVENRLLGEFLHHHLVAQNLQGLLVQLAQGEVLQTRGSGRLRGLRPGFDRIDWEIFFRLGHAVYPPGPEKQGVARFRQVAGTAIPIQTINLLAFCAIGTRKNSSVPDCQRLGRISDPGSRETCPTPTG